MDQDITVDLLECVPGRSDSYAYRGFRCHNFAYPSYPAVLHTDFYAKDCIDPIETRQANLGSRQRPMYVDVMDGIDSGVHTQVLRHGATSRFYAQLINNLNLILW